MTINLAPNHKQGLLIENRVMLAGGSVGYGEAMHRGVQPEKLGAIVVGPIMRHSHLGAPLPRLAETSGGIVLDAGLQNRGLSAVLKKFAKGWAKLGCPVIAQVAGSDQSMLVEVVERLTDVAMGMGPIDVELAAIEWLLPRKVDTETLRNTLRVVMDVIDLPLMIKLPLENVVSFAPIAAEMNVSSLVIGQPIAGAGTPALHADSAMVGDNKAGNVVVGDLFGPLAFAPMMAALHEVTALDLSCTIVASGGIHTLAQAKEALAAGADAIQIDSAVWIEPGLPAFIAQNLAD